MLFTQSTLLWRILTAADILMQRLQKNWGLRDYDSNEDPRREAPFPPVICIFVESQTRREHNAKAPLTTVFLTWLISVY